MSFVSNIRQQTAFKLDVLTKHFLYFCDSSVPSTLCRGYKNAIKKYSEAIKVAGDVPEALAPGLLNRAIAEFKLMNYGRALQDAERSVAVQPGQFKAHYW